MCQVGRMFQARLDLLQNQFSSNPDLMARLVAMPDAPMFLSVWEGNGISGALKSMCEQVYFHTFTVNM